MVPEREELLLRLKNISDNFINNCSNIFLLKNKNLDLVFNKLKTPNDLFSTAKENLLKIRNKFINSEKFFFDLLRNRLKSEVGKLEIGSHQNTLKRGYTYIKDLKNNLFIKSAKNIKENANLKISFYDGNIKAIAKLL